jgi:CheY-like chemotaxis protein
MKTYPTLRILLVEDDNAIANVIAIAMQGLGVAYQLDQVISAEDALDLWAHKPYDLLLTDYNLRGMNGLSIVTQLRQQGEQVPMVLFTAYDTPQLRRAAEAAGVSRFVTKPFLIEDFVVMARNLLPLAVNEVGTAPLPPA